MEKAYGIRNKSVVAMFYNTRQTWPPSPTPFLRWKGKKHLVLPSHSTGKIKWYWKMWFAICFLFQPTLQPEKRVIVDTLLFQHTLSSISFPRPLEKSLAPINICVSIYDRKTPCFFAPFPALIHFLLQHNILIYV